MKKPTIRCANAAHGRSLFLFVSALAFMLSVFPIFALAQGNPQPAILGTSGSSNRAVVFPDPGANPNSQLLVPGLPANASPHGVAYFGADNALISDFLNSRIFVVQISTATLLATINTATYNGTGAIAVAPDRQTALAIGSNNVLNIIRAPFGPDSVISTITLPSGHSSFQTQSIAFDNSGRGFINTIGGIVVIDPPYEAVNFTIPHPTTGDVAGALAISPDGNNLLVTRGRTNSVAVYTAPFSAASIPESIVIPGILSGTVGANGIKIAPDGNTAIVVSSGVYFAAFIRAPFTASSIVEPIPLPSGNSGTFEDVDISADGSLAILTGNATLANQLPVLIRAPFTAAGTTTSNITIQGVANPGRGAGAVRFLPPGLAPGLTIEKSAAATVPSGANLTYSITYGNSGQLSANNVVISDPLPAGTTFVSADSGGTLVDGNVVFNVGTVPAGSAGLTVSFTVNVSAPPGSSVNNNNYTIAATGVTAVPGPPVSTTVVCPEITVSPATLPNGTVGIAYSQLIAGSGGAAPYSFAVTAGSLPAGLELGTNGQITGTPTGEGTSTFTVTVTDANDCTGLAELSITIVIAPPPGGDPCPRSQGYWRNNPGEWPVDSLTLGQVQYNSEQLMALFKRPPSGDASMILAHQLIAAKLNVAAGSDAEPIQSTIAAADALLSGSLPLGVKPSSPTGRQMTELASVLDAYNNGKLTPDCGEPAFFDGKTYRSSLFKNSGAVDTHRAASLAALFGPRAVQPGI